MPELFAQDLLDPGDSLVDRLLGADALSGDAMDGVAPHVLPAHEQVSRITGGARITVGPRAGQELDRRGHVMRVARVEPERRIEQLRHRRQQALGGEVEIMHEPALAHEEVHELLGEGNMPPSLEGLGRKEAGADGERLAVGASRPFDRRSVLVVIFGTLARSCREGGGNFGRWRRFRRPC